MPESKTSMRRVEVAERRGKALRLRAAGRTYDEITTALGYRTRSACIQDIQRALASTVREPADDVRQIELERLDIALRVALEVLTAKHVAVSHGRVILDPVTHEPLRDHGPRLAAIDRLLRISESRRKLLGLDAPTKVEVLTIDAIDAAIRDAEAELTRRATAAEALQAAGPEEADL